MADFKLGSVKPAKMYIGTTEVKKIYYGSTEIWTNTDDWDSFIQTITSGSPIVSYNDMIYVAESACIAYDDDRYDGRVLVYWKDDINSNACILENTNEDFPQDISGFIYLGSCDISLNENPADIMAINTTTVYLLVPTSLTSITVYYKNIS